MLIVQAHPELFPSESSSFGIDSFHIQGSRILSRSFTIPLSRSDPSKSKGDKHEHDHESDEEEDDEEEEEEEIAVMVPMADMLNAAYERDNARLFGDDEEDAGEAEGEVLDKLGEGYTMISTKNIKKGEQIVSPPLAGGSMILEYLFTVMCVLTQHSSIRTLHLLIRNYYENTVISTNIPSLKRSCPSSNRMKWGTYQQVTRGTKWSLKVIVY